MAAFYYATSHKASAVTHSAVAAFTAAGDVNLVVGRTTRLEIHRVTPEGLVPVYDVALHCRIGTINVIRVPVRAALGGRAGLDRRLAR
jgi:DNA damage-binding protein 1